MFFPEIEEVGFSLNSIPRLHSEMCHFAVRPSGFWPRLPGSIDLASKPPTVPSNRGSASIWESRFSACIVRGVRRTPRPAPGSNWTLGGFARFRVVFRGFRRRFYGTNGRSRRETVHGASKPVIALHEIPTAPSDFGVWVTQHLVLFCCIPSARCFQSGDSVRLLLGQKKTTGRKRG